MSINWKRVVKYVWVSSSLFMLALGLGTCLVDPGYYASLNLTPVMLLLSFPSGPLAFVVGGLFIDTSLLDPPFHYSLLWFVAFVAGYVQWFLLVPALFEQSGTITLGLTSIRQPRQTNTVAGNPPMQTSLPTVKPLRIRPQRMVHFDRHGRTPLERVIRDRLRLNNSS